MIKIRLAKIGKKNAPAYRVVVANQRDKRNGRSLEILGHYNPSEPDAKLVIDKKQYEEWIKVGAQPTQAVLDLLAGKYEFVSYSPNKTDSAEMNSDTKSEETEQAPAQEEKAETTESSE